MSPLDHGNLGFALLIRSLVQLDSACLVFGVTRLDLSLSTLDPGSFGLFSSMHSFAHLGFLLLVYGLVNQNSFRLSWTWPFLVLFLC